MLTAMPSDMFVLLKLIMLWLSALVSLTDCPFNVKVVPELMKAEFAIDIELLTTSEFTVYKILI